MYELELGSLAQGNPPLAVTDVGNLAYTSVYDRLGTLVGFSDDNQLINDSPNPNFGKEVVVYADARGNVLSTTDISGYKASAGLYHLDAR